jgi:hypothetical protein
MGLNSRYQFVLLYTVGWKRIAAAAADIDQAIEDGAFRVGEQAGLPLHRFNWRTQRRPTLRLKAARSARCSSRLERRESNLRTASRCPAGSRD